MRVVARAQLAPWQEDLLVAAEHAARTANCSFSGYPVGAAMRVRTRSGELVTVTGNNSETAHYRSVCAEKHAIHRVLAEHSWFEGDQIVRPEILAVAVYCAVGISPQQPCGDCRETLHQIDPDMEVIAAAGRSQDGGPHDPRVTLTTIKALLPHGFEIESLSGDLESDSPGSGESSASTRVDRLTEVLHEPENLEDHVVHLPRPANLGTDREQRLALLPGVRYLILVGSPRRARRIARIAHQSFGAVHDPDGSCYCDLTVPGRDETGREYAVYVPELGQGGPRVAVVSHGIGKAGVEIVLSELPALLALIGGGEPPDLRAAIRCGTRGTLSRVPLGSIALSTSTLDEGLERIEPSADWVERLRTVARARGMTVVGDRDIDRRGEDDWGEPASTLVEGPGISTSFFWQGQARPLYRAGRGSSAPDVDFFERRARAQRLAGWVRAGVRWIEMEDYTVLRVAEACGIPAVSMGAVIAHRRRADGSFQLDYSKSALSASELIPAELALQAILEDAADGE